MRNPGYDPFYDIVQIHYEPVSTAAFIIGTGISIYGQVKQGIDEQAAADRQAAQQKKSTNATYTNARNSILGQGDTAGALEMLHDEEKMMQGSLTAGAASSGIKVSATEDVQRAKISATHIKSDNTVKDIGVDIDKPTSTMDALRNQITKTYNKGEADLYSDLAMAKQGKENSLFSANETKLAGEQALWDGIIGGTGTLLTGAAKGFAPKSSGGFGWGGS